MVRLSRWTGLLVMLFAGLIIGARALGTLLHSPPLLYVNRLGQICYFAVVQRATVCPEAWGFDAQPTLSPDGQFFAIMYRLHADDDADVFSRGWTIRRSSSA